MKFLIWSLRLSAPAIALFVSVSSNAIALAAGPVAFPGAEGFGANATGGRGGTVVHVTTLADSGPGSFRDAVSQPKRTVVFDVGGVIELKSQVVLSSDLTIAGQTAPGDGITLYGRGISASNKSNIVMRYMRIRSSHLSSRGSKTLNVSAGDNMMFDHLSISWGMWDNLGFTQQAHDITLQNCIVSEGIKGVGGQQFGALIDGATNITVARTLWIDNQSRNPKGKGNLQYINNVVYNWGGNGYVGGHSGAVWNQDLINNYFIKGPSSGNNFLSEFKESDHIFHTGNVVDLDRDGKLNGRAIAETDFHGGPTFVTTVFNHPVVPVVERTADGAFQIVTADSGCSLHRDAVDKRIIDQVLSLGTKGAIIIDETVVGGLGDAVAASGGKAPVDSDHDGIPDAWETAHGLDPNNAADAAKAASPEGYTNLELYLNSLVEKHESK